jgi:hypothetical protein
VSLLEVQAAMSSFLETALDFVPSPRRPAFLAAIRSVLGTVDVDADETVSIELPEADVAEEADVVGVAAEREDEDEAAGAATAPSPIDTVRAAPEVVAEPAEPAEPAGPSTPIESSSPGETEAAAKIEPRSPVDTPSARQRRRPPWAISTLDRVPLAGGWGGDDPGESDTPSSA